MNFFSLLTHNRPGTRGPSRLLRRPGVSLILEALEDRNLPSATISGYVFLDANNNGLYDPGESPIANNSLELLNANGVVIGHATSNSAGYYVFATDNSINTSPKTESFTLNFPTNKTNQSQSGTLPMFDPSLGTLTSIDLSINGKITSDIKVENQDPSPATIQGVISGALNLSGPDFNTQVTTSSSTKTFNASAWDHVNDFAGSSGKDFGNATVNGSKTIQLTSAAALADYLGTGAVAITETAQATSSANGGGNLLVNVSSTGAGSVTITYHYRPGNMLRPGNYTIVEVTEPPGTINGRFSRNGQVLPPNNGPGPDTIPITLTGGDAPNNDFGKLLPTADLGIVKTGSPNPVLVNAPLTFTLTVTNYGPLAASQVRVQDVLPPGVGFVSAFGAGWTLSQSGGTVVGTLPGLAVGASSVITINATAPGTPGFITNTATVSSQTPDNNPGNNQSSFQTRVVTPTVIIQQTHTTFPNPHDTDFLGKVDFLAVRGAQGIDPTLLAEATFVDGLYLTILNRPADEAGLINSVKLLRAGGSRAQVVQTLWDSDEHRLQEISDDYLSFLHRPVDAGAQAQWLNYFHGGGTEDGLEQQLLSSPEYQATHPAAGDFITGLYQDVLGRLPDAGALGSWEAALQGGVSRAAVVSSFLNSDERDLNVIDDSYQDILRRNPSPGEQAMWLNQLHAGQATPATLAVNFLGSDEFYTLAVKASMT